MGIKYNGSDVQAIYYNGFTIAKMMNNGNTVWTKPFSAVLILSDNFNRANSEYNVGTPTFGSYSDNFNSGINTNQWKPAYQDRGWTALLKPASKKFRMEAKLKRTSSSGEIGFIVDGESNIGGTSGVGRLVFSNNAIKLFILGGGSSATQQQAYTFTNNVIYNVKVEYDGTTLTCYVNDAQVLTRAINLTAPKMGLYHSYCYGSHLIDDFNAYEI